MRLWTQARQMGAYCGRAMVLGNNLSLDFCFEMFTHVTSFFGFKVCVFFFLSLKMFEIFPVNCCQKLLLNFEIVSLLTKFFYWFTLSKWFWNKKFYTFGQNTFFFLIFSITFYFSQSFYLLFLFKQFGCKIYQFFFKTFLQVIFLGRFNGEGVEKPFQLLLRITKDVEYVKLIVANGRVQGLCHLLSSHFL